MLESGGTRKRGIQVAHKTKAKPKPKPKGKTGTKAKKKPTKAKGSLGRTLSMLGMQ